MKTTDLIEALQTADKLYREKYKMPMEIFDLDFDDDDGIRINACSRVKYRNDTFKGSKSGLKPLADVVIRFECEDGKIDDRSVYIEDDPYSPKEN